MRPTKLVMLHCPKAAGTSVSTYLGAFFKNKTDLPAASFRLSDESKWPNYKAFDFIHGHCGYDLVRYLGAEFQCVTSFRHPVARLASLYNFWRNDTIESQVAEVVSEKNPPPHKIAQHLAHELSFSEWVASDENAVTMYTRNAHTRQILRNWWTPKDLSWFDMEIVKHRIRKMPWFYIAELQADSMRLLDVAFGKAITKPDLGRENVTTYARKPQTSPTAKDAEVIARYNAADILIYNYALKRQKSAAALMSRSSLAAG
ncbi:MAG: hypothetical protein Q7T81_15700 [Pseudolabrys sp.]|nr:hypothetical protein [Pseudolabrys sp.]